MKVPKFQCELSEDNYRLVAKKQADKRINGEKFGLSRCVDMLLTELRKVQNKKEHEK